MAQDYHIYIHDSNGAGNKTTPFSAKKENGNNASFPTKISKAFSGAEKIGKNWAVDTSTASFSTVAPYVALAAVVVKGVESVIATGFAHQEEYTGNYTNNVNYQNYKAGVNAILHPFRTLLNYAHRTAQINKNNKEITQQNRLIGNSILKDFNIGV